MAEPSYSEISHADHRFLSPFSPERAERLIGILGVRPGDSVLDLCCGKGEFVVRLGERTGACCVGIDISERYIAAGRAEAARRGVSGLVELRCEDALGFSCGTAPFAVSCWIGGAAQAGSFERVAQRLASMTATGGTVFIAELFWARQPEPGHIAAFFAGSAEGGLLDHAGNARAGEAAGLTLLHTETATLDDWDVYEGMRLRAIRRWADEHASDPRADAFQERARTEYAEYLVWRREALGFGFYVYEKR